ncbi:hypothetical protein [Longimicrobium sp.]|uniref:hypothetical protein n=1 Tax=Longimicrobium sp. TaxID=2029185 RepID=UPI003B3A2D70
MQDERNLGTAGGGSTGGTGSGLGSTGSGLSGSTGTGGTDTLAGANRVGGLEELQERADNLMDQAADQLETVAEKVDSVAGLIPKKGLGERANTYGHTAADTLESVARFLRDNDVNTLQRELGGLVSTRPLSMLLLAVGAGFVAGKALR